MALQDPIAHPALLPECNQAEIQLRNTIAKYSCKTYVVQEPISHLAVKRKENTFMQEKTLLSNKEKVKVKDCQMNISFQNLTKDLTTNAVMQGRYRAV